MAQQSYNENWRCPKCHRSLIDCPGHTKVEEELSDEEVKKGIRDIVQNWNKTEDLGTVNNPKLKK